MSVTGERLRRLREKSGKSQREVAKLLGISRPAYVSYETGRTTPSRKIKELSNLFNVPADYILGTSDSPYFAMLSSDESTPFGRAVKSAMEKEQEGYFTDKETAELAEALKDDDFRTLLKAKRKLPPKELEVYMKMLKGMISEYD